MIAPRRIMILTPAHRLSHPSPSPSHLHFVYPVLDILRFRILALAYSSRPPDTGLLLQVPDYGQFYLDLLEIFLPHNHLTSLCFGLR